MNLSYSASVSHVTRAALTNERVKREEGPSITGSCSETDLTKSVLKRIKRIPPSISFDGAHVLQTTQITSQTKAQLHISAEAHRGQIHRNEGLDKSIMISQFQSAAVCTFQAQPSHWYLAIVVKKKNNPIGRSSAGWFGAHTERNTNEEHDLLQSGAKSKFWKQKFTTQNVCFLLQNNICLTWCFCTDTHTHKVRGKDTQSVSLPLTWTHVHHDNRGHVMSRTYVALDWQGRCEGEVSRKFNLVTCRPAARAVRNACFRGLCWFSCSAIRSRSCEVTVDRPRLPILNRLSFRRTVRMWLEVDQISRLQLHRVRLQLRRWQARRHRSAQEIHGRSWT